MKRYMQLQAMRGRAGMSCRIALLPLYLLTIILLTACSVIDEDRSDCEEEEKKDIQAEVNYEVRLVTNMTTELHTELTTKTDTLLAHALREHLSGIFADFAHDVDLSFYDTQGDSILLQKDEHIMDASQTSYALNLPMRQYMHLAVANVVNNGLVTVENDDRCHRSMLSQVKRDTIDSHDTGLYTARLPMEVLGNVSQHFDVQLYMANCAAALVIDPLGHEMVDKIRVYSTGFATGYNICDSTYQYSDKPPVVRTSTVTMKGSDARAYCSVTFPSREPEPAAATRTVVETVEPFIAEPGKESLWEFRVYVRQFDGSITETVLRIKEPLRAGQLKIIKCWLGDNGAVITRSSEVSTSVTLDWKDGLEIVT